MSQVQETINQSENALSTISFQQKSTALSLIITGSATAYYIANMWPMRPIALANDIIPQGYGSLLLTTLALIIVAEVILQIVLVIGAGSAPAALAHEKQAALKARRNAYGVLAFGALAAIGSVFLEELTPFCTANLAFLGLAFAEIVKFGSQLFYARR
ncbi:MAG: hypothetical protein H6659_10205 [Ardenticatenaceae bacterium]|nr:hypothetical protein [Ardenticatenaceae bacterium]MCB8986508.1 hypothetical protein [Ardenticatenaceae bacterium]